MTYRRLSTRPRVMTTHQDQDAITSSQLKRRVLDMLGYRLVGSEGDRTPHGGLSLSDAISSASPHDTSWYWRSIRDTRRTLLDTRLLLPSCRGRGRRHKSVIRSSLTICTSISSNVLLSPHTQLGAPFNSIAASSPAIPCGLQSFSCCSL